MGDERAPVRFAWRLARRGDDFEVARAVGVGLDVEDVAVIHRLVAQAQPARRDQQRRRGRIVEIDDARLRRVVAVHGNDRSAGEPRRRDRDEPGGIGLLENDGVLALRGAEAMQHHPPGAMVFVLRDVEKGARIARPHGVAGGVLDAVGQVGARGDVAHADRIHLGALVVGAPGEFPVIGRMARAREVEERFRVGALVAVEQHRFLAARARPAAEDALLAAVAEARIIGPGAVRLGNLAVVLLQPRAHLAHELALKRAGRPENLVGVGVLRLEQRANVGRQRFRVAQHLAPVVGANPGVVVAPGDAVGAAFVRSLFSPGRRLLAARLGVGHGSRAPIWLESYCHGRGGKGRRVGRGRDGWRQAPRGGARTGRRIAAVASLEPAAGTGHGGHDSVDS